MTVVDCHVHACSFVPGDGVMSDALVSSGAFRFMRWRLGLGRLTTPEENQRKVENKLREVLRAAPEVDVGVVLAFDAVHRRDGTLDPRQTHLWVTNDAACRLAATSPKLRWGCSVHPYRKDAAEELQRCHARGAVLCKWLPITQGFSPDDPECLRFYDALAEIGMVLLSHTGGEKSLPQLRPDTADPDLLLPALRRGVRVIMAHCGTRSTPLESDHYDRFARLACAFEHCYGDTSALCLPTRWYGLRRALDHEPVRNKLVHGSDWPIIALPDPALVGGEGVREAMAEPNWLRRDVLIKRRVGLGEAYWNRAARVLGID